MKQLLNAVGTMKRFLLINIFSVLFLVVGCRTVHIFEPAPLFSEKAASQRPIVQAVVANDPAHLWQAMDIYEDGLAVVIGQSQYQEKRGQLSSQQIQALLSQFVETKFMLLPEQLIDKSNFSPAYYEIALNSGQNSNKVRTNDLVGNLPVSQLLSSLDALARRVVEDGLEISLSLSRKSLSPGETVALQLIVRNTSREFIQLYFPTGRVYQFTFKPQAGYSADLHTPAVAFNNSRIENAPVVSRGLIRPGEAISYALAWDGRDAQGVALRGTVMVSAELLSVPGGITAATAVVID